MVLGPLTDGPPVLLLLVSLPPPLLDHTLTDLTHCEQPAMVPHAYTSTSTQTHNIRPRACYEPEPSAVATPPLGLCRQVLPLQRLQIMLHFHLLPLRRRRRNVDDLAAAARQPHLAQRGRVVLARQREACGDTQPTTQASGVQAVGVSTSGNGAVEGASRGRLAQQRCLGHTSPPLSHHCPAPVVAAAAAAPEKVRLRVTSAPTVGITFQATVTLKARPRRWKPWSVMA